MKILAIAIVMLAVAGTAAAETLTADECAAEARRQREVERHARENREGLSWPGVRPSLGLKADSKYISIKTAAIALEGDYAPFWEESRFKNQNGQMFSGAFGLRFAMPKPSEDDIDTAVDSIIDSAEDNPGRILAYIFIAPLLVELFSNVSHLRLEGEVAAHSFNETRGATYMANFYMDWLGDYRISPYFGAGLGFGHFGNARHGMDTRGVAFGTYIGLTFRMAKRLSADVGANIRPILGSDLTIFGGSLGLRYNF